MLTTNCPTCATAFRVTPEQLKARAGKVRCGHCNAVFNALESLNDLPAAQETPPEAPEESGPPSSPPEPLPPESAADAAAPDGPDNAAVMAIPDYDPGPTAQPVSQLRLAAWGTACLFALTLLAVQAAYFLRTELAASHPEWRPMLEVLCEQLECDIPLPRKPELVGIETSDLHPDPQRKNLLVLAATLKNRAPFVQAYPHLELTLTDTHDQPINRKVFAPAEYLPQGTDAPAGFAANGDLAVSLWLDAGEAGASGYRLYLFYP